MRHVPSRVLDNDCNLHFMILYLGKVWIPSSTQTVHVALCLGIEYIKSDETRMKIIVSIALSVNFVRKSITICPSFIKSVTSPTCRLLEFYLH